MILLGNLSFKLLVGHFEFLNRPPTPEGPLTFTSVPHSARARMTLCICCGSS